MLVTPSWCLKCLSSSRLQVYPNSIIIIRVIYFVLLRSLPHTTKDIKYLNWKKNTGEIFNLSMDQIISTRKRKVLMAKKTLQS